MMRPEDIKNRTFANSIRGYDKDEVRSFLFKVAESSQELHDQLTATEAELSAAVDATRVDDDNTEPWGDDVVAAPVVDDEVFSIDDATVDTLPVAALQSDVDDVVPEALASPPAHDEVDAGSTHDLVAVEQSIADRYGELGDRIADLLRNADDSATAIIAAAEHDSEEMRTTAATEAAQVRADAEARAAEMFAEARAIRDEVDAYRDQVTAELEVERAEQEAALAEAKAAAEAEVETFRVNSINEIETLRTDAVAEVEALRGGASAEVDELRVVAQRDADALRESAIADGQSAIAEDEAAAARLVQEAETDRRAARSELDDVRSEVSSLLEQARTQSEFIKQEADEIIRTKVRSNFEQAQNRIDVLRNTEIASRERIVRAQTELSSALTRLDSEPAPELDPGAAAAVIEEAELRQVELTDPSVFHEDASFEGGPTDAAPLSDDDVFEVEEIVEADAAADVATDPESAEWGGQATFEADVAEATQQIDADTDDGSPLSAFFGPGPDSAGDAAPDGFAATEYVETEYVEAEAVDAGLADPAPETAEAPAADDLAGDSFEVTEHVVDESSSYGDLPLRGQAPDPSAEADLPASLEESLPAAPDIGGRAEEDALARLVREAMQEAVDSARKND